MTASRAPLAPRARRPHMRGHVSGTPKEPALRLIIAYKWARAATSLLAAAGLLLLTITGHTAALLSIVQALHRHATSEWSVALAASVVKAVTPRHLWIVAGALTVDGAFTALEGWALEHGADWGPWLVTAATCTFIPFETAALVHRVDALRALVLVLNVAIVLYLGRRALRRARSRSAEPVGAARSSPAPAAAAAGIRGTGESRPAARLAPSAWPRRP